MNAPLIPERLLLGDDTPQQPLPLASPGILRWVWQGRFATMLIEVEGEEIRVDGQRVERCPPGRPADGRPRGTVPPDGPAGPTP